MDNNERTTHLISKHHFNGFQSCVGERPLQAIIPVSNKGTLKNHIEGAYYAVSPAFLINESFTEKT